MAGKKNNAAPFIAFIPIGSALVVIGTGSEPLFLLAGVLMILAGVIGILRTRKAKEEDDQDEPS